MHVFSEAALREKMKQARVEDTKHFTSFSKAGIFLRSLLRGFLIRFFRSERTMSLVLALEQTVSTSRSLWSTNHLAKKRLTTVSTLDLFQ